MQHVGDIDTVILNKTLNFIKWIYAHLEEENAASIRIVDVGEKFWQFFLSCFSKLFRPKTNFLDGAARFLIRLRSKAVNFSRNILPAMDHYWSFLFVSSGWHYSVEVQQSRGGFGNAVVRPWRHMELSNHSFFLQKKSKKSMLRYFNTYVILECMKPYI